MKTTKKLVSLALAAMLLLSLAVPAMAADSDFYIVENSLVAYMGSGGDVVIPDGVTEIGNLAFYVDEFVSEMGNSEGCSKVTSIVIPSSVTSIKGNAFANCTSLKSITIPASVTSVDSYPFISKCTSLTDVYYGGTKEQWETLEQMLLIDEYDGLLSEAGAANVTVHYNSTGPDDTETPETPTTPTTPSFGDVAADAWYAAPVAWAVEKGITNGTGANKFSPNKTCNNSEILTFLWRACGKPEAPAASFTDVASGAWYADAANWARSKGMVSGDTLSPTEPCTRASAVMYIWQAMGKPAASKAASFSDVDASSDYAAAVAWAVEKGVTNGTGADTFSPGTICTRAQIVTFLQRAYAE